ncbi:hypothetical protein G9400_22600 [Klebsiella michiganensis]|uniref:hypothetical protein n=1 Tax=Klebsiella/Raoultella group TaxID=2890311 RepID=UPI000C2954DA|nr:MULTISPECIES: hypothetical protein [Klebsiella/Raoultella group]MDU4798122.1 hypothetical protein [Klebsiella michiganensis]MCC7905175.1 hypothetical protein [Klebsiella pneumoniae]NHE82291.1 hypothetical protein [Klebsiella michiganensis]PJR10635.1 hypothetical protein CDD79_07030 [Raoultella ornithinolytica]PQH19999.1 hypothetical protein C5T95_25110 [Raoultella ornithinolytica]
MKVIKYWQVLLFRISQPSSIINDRKPIETLVFGGYSKEKPNIKLGTGLSIELFTAPDSLETQIIRDHLIDIVRCFPVCEDDGDEKDGTSEKIHDHSCVNCFADKGPCLGECNVYDENRNLAAGIMQEYFPNGGRDWDQILSLFDAISAGKIPGVQAQAMQSKTSSFEGVVKPVIKWLNENTNPHTSVNIDATSAQLLTGEIGIHTEEFLKD